MQLHVWVFTHWVGDFNWRNALLIVCYQYFTNLSTINKEIIVIITTATTTTTIIIIITIRIITLIHYVYFQSY